MKASEFFWSRNLWDILVFIDVGWFPAKTICFFYNFDLFIICWGYELLSLWSSDCLLRCLIWVQDMWSSDIKAIDVVHMLCIYCYKWSVSQTPWLVIGWITSCSKKRSYIKSNHRKQKQFVIMVKNSNQKTRTKGESRRWIAVPLIPRIFQPLVIPGHQAPQLGEKADNSLKVILYGKLCS